MVRINLLPWRAARRKQREKTFLAMMAGAVVVGLLLSLLFWSYLNGQISGQRDRNAFMEGEISKVEAQIKDIDQLKAKKEALLSRKQVIEELQANRYRMVHLFDALMRTLPDGLVLTGLKQEGDQLTIEGRAQSNARVATYMRNLESAGWTKNPDVTVIEATPLAATGQSPPPPGSAAPANTDNTAASLPYMFTLRVTMASPSDPHAADAAPIPDPVAIRPMPAAVPATPAAISPAVAPPQPAPAQSAPASAAPPANQEGDR